MKHVINALFVLGLFTVAGGASAGVHFDYASIYWRSTSSGYSYEQKIYSPVAESRKWDYDGFDTYTTYTLPRLTAWVYGAAEASMTKAVLRSDSGTPIDDYEWGMITMALDSSGEYSRRWTPPYYENDFSCNTYDHCYLAKKFHSPRLIVRDNKPEARIDFSYGLVGPNEHRVVFNYQNPTLGEP